MADRWPAQLTNQSSWQGRSVMEWQYFGQKGPLFGDTSAHFFCFAAAAFGFDHLPLRSAGSSSTLAAGFGEIGQPGLTLNLPLPLDLIEQPFKGQLSVGDLRTRIARNHAQTTRFVNQSHGCRNFINVLTSRSRRTCEGLEEILRSNTKFRHAFRKHAASFWGCLLFRKPCHRTGMRNGATTQESPSRARTAKAIS